MVAFSARKQSNKMLRNRNCMFAACQQEIFGISAVMINNYFVVGSFVRFLQFNDCEGSGKLTRLLRSLVRLKILHNS